MSKSKSSKALGGSLGYDEPLKVDGWGIKINLSLLLLVFSQKVKSGKRLRQ